MNSVDKDLPRNYPKENFLRVLVLNQEIIWMIFNKGMIDGGKTLN